MSFDPMDVWGGAVGSLFKRVFLFISAVWIGSLIGLISLLVSWLAAGGTPVSGMIGSLVLAPLALLNSWFLLNFVTMVIGLAYCIKAEDPGYRGWMILTGFTGLGVKFGDSYSFGGTWLPVLAGWMMWLVLLAMLGAGVWLLWQVFRNRWAHHLIAVQAENVIREVETQEMVRARLEATKPPKAPHGVIVELKR